MQITKDQLPPGTPVLVRAVVVDERVHPEDVAVELFSHNEQYSAAVRPDHLVLVPGPSVAGEVAESEAELLGQAILAFQSAGCAYDPSLRDGLVAVLRVAHERFAAAAHGDRERLKAAAHKVACLAEDLESAVWSVKDL